MPQLDFKEIAKANVASGEQDAFELFTRDFLELLGYKALSGPDRGTDLGRDLIVLETRTGIVGETLIRWLVSCKHKAHSGLSVGLSDEQDISDRVRVHDCTGFIGVYSTLPASSLSQKLDGMKRNTPSFESQIFDREKIERILLSSGPGQGIARRYFPNSYNKWRKEHFDISLALARFGMPQPVAYKLPNDDTVLTVDEVWKRYPQANQVFFDPFMPRDWIICNNILGITRVMKDGEIIDPPSDYFERRMERINQELETIRQQSIQDDVENGTTTNRSEGSNANKRSKSSKQRLTKASRRRNRKR